MDGESNGAISCLEQLLGVPGLLNGQRLDLHGATLPTRAKQQKPLAALPPPFG